MQVPTGWKLVPIEPTKEMMKAGYEAKDIWDKQHCDNMREYHYSFSKPRWDAMLNSAPEYKPAKGE